MSKRLHSINAAMNKQRWIVQPMCAFDRLLYRRRTQELTTLTSALRRRIKMIMPVVSK